MEWELTHFYTECLVELGGELLIELGISEVWKRRSGMKLKGAIIKQGLVSLAHKCCGKGMFYSGVVMVGDRSHP